jgi:asparagine synthase (glutamine-hydrolysing)
MEEILPLEIRKKKKQGFGLPIAVWMRREGQLRELINDVVLSERAQSRGYFNPEFVRDLIDRHERNLWDHAPDIFRLLMLELWHREYFDHHG